MFKKPLIRYIFCRSKTMLDIRLNEIRYAEFASDPRRGEIGANIFFRQQPQWPCQGSSV